MGIFDNLNTDADVFENSKYFQPGRYIVDIKQCKFISGGHKGDSFVIEATIVGAIPDPYFPAAYALAHPGKAPPLAPTPGELAAQVWNASGDKRDIARNTWLGFLCAICGAKQTDYDDKQWKTISMRVIGDNAFGGKRAYLEVFMKKTLAGGDFTQHAWRGAPTAEQLAEFGIAA